MKIDLVQYVVGKAPSIFFSRVSELVEEAFFAAFQYAETLEEPERRRLLGQLRHYHQNAALRKAGIDSGLIAAAPHTDPMGERYSMVAAEDIRFGRIGVPFGNNLARFSKHRAAIAAVNSRLEPVSLDMFSPTPARPTEGLGCMVVTVNPHWREAQSVPEAILIGVPYSNLRGWHLLEPIENVMAAYNPAADVEVPDLAWATLKKQLGEAGG